ncbi:hypothetical protein HJ526_18240 [Donghicola sp. C2-DW-16]|uniref:Uncharacterized protein n=1 Tax=Donghicola mangrovi TaxID=2729614 RepID=A0ABX2PIL6_9RHOB|nr:hypothetical protein [Donghicola mangrovi]NVO29365.1 hypothetical protein [Donghicola mangrovi]
MSDVPENLFEFLYRRMPTEEEKDRLLRIKEALGLSNRDEFWPLILVLEYYTRIFVAARFYLIKEVREEIQKLKQTLQKSGALAETQARAAVARAIDESAEQIAKRAGDAVEQRADLLSKRAWMRGAMLGGALGVGLMVIGAAATYGVVALHGICDGSKRHRDTQGATVCYVKPLPFSGA